MLDAENPTDDSTSAGTDLGGPPAADAASGVAKKATTKKAAAKKATTKKAAAKKSTVKKAATKKTAALDADAASAGPDSAGPPDTADTGLETKKKTPAKRTAVKKTPAKAAAKSAAAVSEPTADAASGSTTLPIMPMFQAPDPTKVSQPRRRSTPKKKVEPTESGDVSADEAVNGAVETPPAAKKRASRPTKKQAAPEVEPATAAEESSGDKPVVDHSSDGDGEHEGDEHGGTRRRRRRGGRRRRKGGADDGGSQDNEDSGESGSGDQHLDSEDTTDDHETSEGSNDGRRRRRRRRAGEDGDGDGDGATDDPHNTVTRVRKARSAEDEITSLHGSTRLEAKKQRRREGREAGRRRAPIVSESEFLARREAVDRVMVIRQRKDLTQIAVLEDNVLVEHYVARESQTSLIGNVYLGRVQNVLPSMEAAFVDIGKGRNAVLYAGEVNWSALGAKHGSQRKIEQVLTSGQSILVQVSKDPIGHKGARLTSQVSLPGRFLVYVPDGTTSGISRKLPDTERGRLKTLLKEIVPDGAGVIVRTAAEGASEEDLRQDVERLTARSENISTKVEKGNAPQLLYGEPDLTLKVVRDLFTEDFTKLVVSGAEAWDMVEEYVKHLAPDLEARLEKYDDQSGDTDVFAAYRVDEQIAKGVDRKVWLPSGGSLVIDRTEAMTVVDVNTGKFTGSGGNLEETVTKNNLEAAEEIVRQLRLRDIGGIIVVDFIDMVLESNRDLVMRRMIECLGRDRTRHQVAEVTSLGLIQMTRKRIGTGLVEAFSETCEHCHGRGLIVHQEPVESRKVHDEEPRRTRRTGRSRGKEALDKGEERRENHRAVPTPKDVAAIAKPDSTPIVLADDEPLDERRSEPAPMPEQPPVETKPAAVTRRRRSASRPAGPPADLTPDSVPTIETGSADGAGPGTPKTAEAVAAPAPKIVTSVRRRGARRPAGPPTDTDSF